MSRRDHFDDGHGMDHHRAIRKAARLATGAIVGASFLGGPLGAAVGAGIFHAMDKHFENKNKDEEDYE